MSGRRSASPAAALGYRRLHGGLRRDGHVLNRKRTRRLSAKEGLAVRRRRGRKRALGTRAPLVTEAVANARWSVDFMQDQFADGRRLRVLNVTDDVTRESLAAVVDTYVREAGRTGPDGADRARRNARRDRPGERHRVHVECDPAMGPEDAGEVARHRTR